MSPEVRNGDLRLFVDVDGEGDPVTVVAHGLTNSAKELATLTPFMPGTSVRFDFRGHGRSASPAAGYTFADFASDLDAVARAYDATRAVGTSLGAGAICRLLEENPARFERIILLLPAGVDGQLGDGDVGRFLDVADLLDRHPKEEAIRIILERPDSAARYAKAPWMRDLSAAIWEDINPKAAAQAIREIVRDTPISDREVLRKVEAPVLIICMDGDPIHPVAVGETLADVLPNSELMVFADHTEIMESIPALVGRAAEFLA